MTESPERLAAVCWAVIDCGIQTWRWTDDQGPRARDVREIRIAWELSEHTRGGRQAVLTKRYNRSFWPTSALSRDLGSWQGGSGDAVLRRLPGQGALLITHRGESGYRFVTRVEPAAVLRRLDREPLWFSLDSFDPEAFHRLPDRLKDYVMISRTFLAQHGHPIDPPEHTRPPTWAELIDDEVPW